MDIIICDDLTGCFDVAENIFDLYERITILTYPPFFSKNIDNSDIVIISSETRNCDENKTKYRK